MSSFREAIGFRVQIIHLNAHANAQLLVFCGAVIRGVHKYGVLLRAVIASANNDHRLGTNEAPPAIISIYLGSQLQDVFDQIA